jgi:solute:Na+ symporter, SSS family
VHLVHESGAPDRRTMSQLHWIDWLVVVVYFAAMVALGVRAARGTSMDDYLVGGRRVGAVAAGLSLLATLISTISFLAYPGEVIANGTGFVWQLLGLPVVFVVVGHLLIPHIMRVPVSSAYELLERRLGGSSRTLAAAVFVVTRVVWMAFILHTASTAISVIVDVPRDLLMVAMTAITVAYTAKGGIKAVIWTDVAQFFLMVAGAVATVTILMGKGAFGVDDLAREGWKRLAETPLLSLDPTVRTSAAAWFLSVTVWWIATCGSDQVAMQRFFTNRDAAVARRTLIVNLAAHAVVLLALAAVGLSLWLYFQTRTAELPPEMRDLRASGDRIFPYFIAHGLPAGLRGLLIAALLAAAMSSLSSGYNSLSAILTVDFLQRGQAPGAVGAARAARNWTLLIAAVTLALGYPLQFLRENFVSLASRLAEPLTGPLFGLFVLAFFFPSVGSRAAIAGFCGGLAVGYAFAFGHLVLGRSEAYSFLWISPASIAATIATALVAACFIPRPPRTGS